MAIFDDLNELIQYNGASWKNSTDFPTNRTGATTKVYISPTSDVSVTFYFTGNYLKTYGAGYSGMNTCNNINIDNVDYKMSTWASLPLNTIAISFEKNDIAKNAHKAVITSNGSARMYLDGVECESLISEEEYLKLLEEENKEEIPNISHKNASLTYTIPMNTTTKILAKTNDPRVGLLGMANDAKNYGDLYVIGGDGKSHLTKSGIKSEVIFEGSANIKGDYILNKNINEFSYLMVFAKIEHASPEYHDSVSGIVHKSEFKDMKIKSISNYWAVDIYYGIEFRMFDSTLNFNGSVKGTSTAWNNPHIYKVIGIY